MWNQGDQIIGRDNRDEIMTITFINWIQLQMMTIIFNKSII